MAEPSRPPPPKAYVPSRKPGVPPSRPSTGPAGGQTELPIPPRPPPEDIPPVSPTELTKSKGGRGPPPPPAPYSKKPSATKLSDGAEDEADKGQAPPKTRPPAPRPAKGPASRPSKPPASSSKKMDITIVSAQPMTSDVIPPPGKGAPPMTDPPMPTEPPPEPPTEGKTPPPKPNRSPPVPKTVLDKESEPLPKRGPAPPKPVRGSPPLPLRGGQDEQGSSSPKEITDRRPSRGSPHVRKAPPPPAGRTRPPPPQSKAPPIPSTEAPSEYTALVPTPANRPTPDSEYIVPQAPTPASEYTEPVSSKTLSKSSADYIEPVSGAKSDRPMAPVHKAPPPPVSRPSAPPTSRSRPPPTSRPPPPTQGKEGPREIESPTHLYAEVSPSTSQTNLEEATPSSRDTPPPVPNSPRPSGQPKLSDSKTSPSPPKKSPPTKPPSSRPRPPPPQTKKEEVAEDKATPTATPTAVPTTHPRPPLPRTTSKDEGIKAAPTPRSKPPLPVATPPQETNETLPTSRPRPPPPKAVPPTPEKSKEENKTPPTSRPRPPPPKTKTDDDQDQDMEKTPPPSKPHPPKPVPRQDSGGGEVKAQPPMKPKPRPKKIPSVSSVEETETTPTNVETATPTEPLQDEVKKEATPPVAVTRPPPKKPPVVPKRSISKTDTGSEEPTPPDTPTAREKSPPPAKPLPPPQAKPRPPPPKSKEEGKTEESPPPPRSLSSATPSSAPPTRPTSGPTKAPPPSRPGQGPKPKPARPPGTAPPKPTPPVPSTRSKPPNKDGPPVPTARRGTASKEDSDAPPPLPPRPEPGHPLYRYVCSNPHGIARTNKEAPEADELSYYEGDVIELIEKIDDHWYYACNADNDMQEGLILAKEMKIIKRLPGQDKVMEDGPCAVAMTAFEGRSSDELSFKEGTLIMLISRVGGDEWLRGRTLKGEEGIFPKSFVEVVEDLPPDAIEELKPASPEYDIPDGPYCIATETFVGESPDDLSFDVGDLIEITERIDDSWLRGTTHGRNGMFPQVFVDVKVDMPVGTVGGGDETENKNENVVKALFDYEGEEGDLSFKEGDMITLLSKVSDEWIYGQLDGREGMFPSSFISHIPESLPMKTTKEEPKVDETTPTPEPPKTPTGECEALFDYESDNLGDLSFTAGEKITLTEWISDEWCSGAIGDRAGMFPLSFVKIIKDLPKDSGSVSKAAAPKSQKKVKSEELSDLMPKAKAIRNFEPASSLEMRVQTGDMIILLSHEAKNMYMGENVTTGEFGNFPANCVEVIVPLP